MPLWPLMPSSDFVSHCLGTRRINAISSQLASSARHIWAACQATITCATNRVIYLQYHSIPWPNACSFLMNLTFLFSCCTLTLYTFAGRVTNFVVKHITHRRRYIRTNTVYTFRINTKNPAEYTEDRLFNSKQHSLSDLKYSS